MGGLLRVTPFRVASPAFRDRDGGTRRLVFSTRTGALVLLEESLYRLMTERPGGLPGPQAAVLRDAGILTAASCDEPAEIIAENRSAASACATLDLVIQPSAACQLQCVYCAQSNGPQRLSPDALDRLVEQIATRLAHGGYAGLHVTWFGREPLLAMGPIRAGSRALRALVAQRGLTYAAKVVTNGIALTRRRAEELTRSCGVSTFEVTLDGPAPFHDPRRPHRTAPRGTFERILANLRAMAEVPELEGSVVLRCNVDRHNAEGVVPLVELLEAHGLRRLISSIYLAPVHDWGNDAGGLALDAQAFAQLEVAFLVELLARGFEPELLPARRPIVCMAVEPDACVVDAYGNLFGCTEVAQLGRYGLGRGGADDGGGRGNGYVIGTVTEGIFPDRADRPGDYSGFNGRLLAGGYPCSACPVLPLCGGGCPKQWAEGAAPCPSIKHNLPQRLMLHLARSRTQLTALAGG